MFFKVSLLRYLLLQYLHYIWVLLTTVMLAISCCGKSLDDKIKRYETQFVIMLLCNCIQYSFLINSNTVSAQLLSSNCFVCDSKRFGVI